VRNRSAPILILTALALISTESIPVFAANFKSTFSLSQTPSPTEPLITFHGVIKPALKNAVVKIFVKLDEKWVDTRLRTNSTSSGAWKIEANATALNAKVSYRAQVQVGKSTINTLIKTLTVKQWPSIGEADAASLIALAGPGGRIHGADISRWQHPNDKPIDFAKMYGAGIRFVMIKASDARDDADIPSLKYLLIDRNAAQAAGIYTGFYHYAYLPNTADPALVIRDAQAQAQKVIWRLASIGGYNTRDLTYALDLENNCIQMNKSKVCAKYATRSNITLWAETWLAIVAEKTGRKPFLYSYSGFLETAMNRSSILRGYPLWMAQYAINPADPIAEPGRKISGCYVNSWSTSNCTSLWQIWQYTSCGIASKYGVPSNRLDLNVYRGDANSFLKLAAGEWIPQVGDLLPINESSTMRITAIKATTNDKSVEVTVEVIRATGTPVVTGTVVFRSDSEIAKKPVQTVVRDAAGVWVLSIDGLSAGSYTGKIVYVDQTGTHAQSEQMVQFILEEGIAPSPKPSATKKPVTPPTDGCKNQIKN